MNTKKVKKHFNDNCSGLFRITLVKQVMRMLSGKWKMQIVTFLLEKGKTRFMELQRGVEGISSRILSKELQEMEQDGIVIRMVRDPKLTTVEYELSVHGRALEGILFSILQWGDGHPGIYQKNLQQCS